MYHEALNSFPLWNWRQCLDGDYTFMRIDRENGNPDDDHKNWEKMYDQYIKKFGIGEDQARVFELKLQIAEAKLEYAIDGDDFLLNNIMRLEFELKEILEREVEGDMDDCLVYLSKWLGYRFNQHEQSVTEFHTAMKNYKKEADRLREITEKNKKK